MLLSNIAIGLVVLLCCAGALRYFIVENRKLEQKIASLEASVHDLTTDIHVTMGEVEDLDGQLDAFKKEMNDKADILEEQEKEIRRWNEGVANIMNYSLDVAKGDKK